MAESLRLEPRHNPHQGVRVAFTLGVGTFHKHEPLNQLLQSHVTVEDATPGIRVDAQEQRNKVACDSAHLLSTACVPEERSLEILRLLNAERLAELNLWGSAEVFQAVQDPGVNRALVDAVREGIDVLVEILMILAASKRSQLSTRV